MNVVKLNFVTYISFKIRTVVGGSLLLLQSTLLVAQTDFSEGFNLLEQGDFKAATTYFEDKVEKNPNNKTAKLCYGRAIGLYNNPKKATTIFNKLLNEFPNDYELELNLAESYMWQKDYTTADSLYQYLAKKDTSNFVAQLGLANASTNLKNHETAVAAIANALTIENGNPSALISKKYIYLAYADELRANGYYKKAHLLLDEINGLFPLDKDIILTKAVVYLNEQKPRLAQKQYNLLIDNNIALSQAYGGKSYCNTILQAPKQALKYAKLAVDNITETTGESISFNAKINLINTLALNQEYQKANDLIDDLAATNTNSTKLQLAKARLNTWQWKFDAASSQYKQLIKQNGETTEILVEYADVLKATNNSPKAIKNYQQALQQDSTLIDVQRNQDLLLRKQRSYITSKNTFASDADNNQAIETNNKFHLVHNHKHKTHLGFGSRFTNKVNTEIDNTATATSFFAGHTFQPHYRLKLSAEAGLYTFKDNIDASIYKLQFAVNANIIISKWQQVNLGFKRSNFNYNTSLIETGIGTNDFIVNHHIYTPIKLGWYTQYIFTTQTDNNTRSLIYSALYYNIMQVPILKVGTTINWFTYKEQNDALYFSPNKFINLAVFSQFHNLDKPHDKIKYHLMAAIGSQQIDKNKWQGTQLIDAKFGYDFNNRILLMGSYLYSNAGQTNIAGFSVHQVGLQLRFIF